MSLLLYGDEADIHLNPHLTRAWFLKGAPREVPAAGTNQRRSLLGAFDPVRRRLFVHAVAEKSAESFVAFLTALLRAYRGRHIYLVLDNGPIHGARLVREFLAKHRQHLTILWLPKYSPNLNLIERLWGHLKRKALSNLFFGTAGRLLVAIHRAVAALNNPGNDFLRILFSTHFAACRTTHAP